MVPKKIVGELVLQLLELADAAGFFCYHLAEHHVTLLARHHRLLFLTAAAQRTLRLAKVTGCNYVICAFA